MRRAVAPIALAALMVAGAPARAAEPPPTDESETVRSPPPRPTAAPQSTTPAPQSTAPPPAEAVAPDALADVKRELARQRDELTQQKAEVAALRAELDRARRPPPAPPPKPEPQHVFLWGFIQADAIVMDQRSQDELNGSTGQPLNDNRFLIRRGRLHVDADYGIPTAALELDSNTINGPQARVIQAEVSVRWRAPDAAAPPYVQATIGLMKIPFGFEVGQLDFDRTFLERSNVIRALFPGEYDLGARLRGGYRSLRYAVALMNGAPAGDAGYALRDPTESKDLVARVGVDTAFTSKLRFAGGFSGVSGTGFHAGTPATKDVLVWRDTNEDGLVQSTEIQVIPGSAPTPSQTFSRFALGADAHAEADLPVVGTLTVYGELVFGSNLDRGLVPADPVVAGRDLREFGFYVAVTQDLTRYAQLGARYDFYDPDADHTDRQAARVVPSSAAYSTLALTAVARLPPHFRLIGEYDKNTNALGRAPNGAPTNFKSDTFTVRGEVKF
ncbi:MAG TPA: hypothetical protein VHB21_23055 [Minicystis sp.]|nr:hypothetical protein [Minicystis sp.]